MNRFQTFLENLRQWIFTVLGKIEESPQFEKILMSYDALDPRYQRRVKGAVLVSTAVAALLIFTLPLIPVFLAKADNSNYRAAIAEMSNFNATANVIVKPALRPAGWIAFPTGTIDDVENSMTQYFATIGVPQDLLEMTKAGDRLNIKFSEVSIRQVVYLIFQIDGWFPALKFDRLRVVVNPEKANLLDLTATLAFDAAEGTKLQSVLGIVSGGGGAPGGGAGAGFDSASGSGFNSNSGSGGGDVDNSGGVPGGDFDYPPPPPPPPDDFSNDLPPPPPFEEDI